VTRSRSTRLAGAVLLALAAAGPARGGAPGEPASPALRLLPASRVKARTLRVEDVAEVRGEGEAAASLRSAEIGPAPAPGFTQALSAATLVETLRARGFDPKSYRVEGPSETIVTADAKTIAAREILAEAAAFAAAELAAAFPGAEIVPEARSTPADVVVAPGREGTRVAFRFRSAARSGRNVWIDSTVTVDGEPAAFLPLQFDVKVVREAVTSTRAVARGEVIGPDALALVPADVSGGAGALVGSLDEAIGLAAARAIPAGAVLRATDLYRPPIVRRGDVVTLRVVSGPMTVTARGVARGEGAEGDVIAVANADTNRIVSGRISAPGLVDVEIGRGREGRP